MRTLSLDLRGVAPTQTLSSDPGTRSASISLIAHTLGISALVLVPLLSSTALPKTRRMFQEPLVRPITVTLPSAPLLGPRGGSQTKTPSSVPAVARDLKTPVETPPMLLVGDLTPNVAEFGEVQPGDSSGQEGAKGGDCALGAMCGTGVPAANTAPAEIPHVGGLIKEPRLIESRAPQYPPVAQAAGVSGTVVLEALVGRDGRVRDTRITQSHRIFDEAALTSVRSRLYDPLLLNGVPSEFMVTITIAFNLQR